MTTDVLCLRPEADFTRVDAPAPATPRVTYREPDDDDVPALMRASDALIIPAVGPKLAPALFEGGRLKLVQVTGAGIDRLDRDAMVRLGVPVANVAGGSNDALAEYAVTAASLLLRRFAWADAELKSGNYASFRARMVADNLAGLDGLLAKCGTRAIPTASPPRSKASRSRTPASSRRARGRRRRCRAWSARCAAPGGGGAQHAVPPPQHEPHRQDHGAADPGARLRHEVPAARRRLRQAQGHGRGCGHRARRDELNPAGEMAGSSRLRAEAPFDGIRANNPSAGAGPALQVFLQVWLTANNIAGKIGAEP